MAAAPAVRPRAVVLGAAVLTVAGLLVLACGGAPAYQAPEPPPTSASPPPTSAPATAGGATDRELSCRELESDYGFHTVGLAQAISAEPGSGPGFRAGVAQVIVEFAQQLELTSSTLGADAQLTAAVVRWAAANREVAQYVRTTEPSGDNVLELGPGNDRERAARAEVEALCGGPFFG